MALERLRTAITGSDAGQTDTLYGLLKHIGSDLVSQGTRIPDDIGILFSLAETELGNGLNDDKKYLVSSHRWWPKQYYSWAMLIGYELVD